MKEFYEIVRENDSRVDVQRNAKVLYPPHYHLNLEILILKKGSFEITLSGKHYTLHSGEVLVVDSYEIHSYDSDFCSGKSDCAVVIFPYSYLHKFNKIRSGMKIKNPIIKDSQLCSELLEITDKYLTLSDRVAKSASDLFLSLLSERLEFVEVKGGEEDLVRRILFCIQKNYRGNISRKIIASELGYTEAHISRVFHRYLGSGISEYVNKLRLSHIEEARGVGDRRPLIELIYEAGFKSIKTYYRVRAKQKREI